MESQALHPRSLFGVDLPQCNFNREGDVEVDIFRSLECIAVACCNRNTAIAPSCGSNRSANARHN